MSDWGRKDIFKLVLSLVFIGAFTFLFLPFTSEILLAAIFALAIEPSLGRWLEPRHFRWKTSVALILLAMFLILALPVTWVAYRTYRYFIEMAKNGVQESELYQKLMTLKSGLVSIVESLAERFGFNLNLSGMLDEGLGSGVNMVVQYATALASNIPGLLMSLFIFCAALYFFLAETRWLKSAFLRQKLLSPKEAQDFLSLLQKSSYSVVVTSIIIATIQATIVTFGALIFRTGDLSVIWVTTFFFSFIPVIGAGPVALVLAALQLVLGNYGAAIGFVVVSVIAGTTDNIVRPYLLSTDQDIHPVLSLLSIIGAIIMFGIPGLFLGPVIASVAIKIIPTLYSNEVIATANGMDPKKKEP